MSETRIFPEQRKDISAELIHRENDRDGLPIEVWEHDNLRWLQIGSDDVQALVSKQHPEKPALSCNQAMLTALLFRPSYPSLLNLGTGGGSFERFFLNTFPDTEIASLDSNSTVVSIARRFLFLDPEHPVIIDDANSFLSRHKKHYSLIFSDIFEQSSPPSCLFNDTYYEHCHRCLDEQGILVLNLAPRSEEELLAMFLGVRKHFNTVAFMNFDHCANYLIFAFKQETTTDSLIAQNDIRYLQERIGLTLTDTLERMVWLPRKSS